MLRRYPVAAVVAASITFGLLYTMQWLIAGQQAVIEEAKQRWELDFIRVKRSEDLNRRERKKPQKIEKPAPPPPAAPTMNSDSPADIQIDIPVQTAALELGDGPYLGGSSDSDVVPIVRVNPEYPTRAASRGVEGWVHLEFTVTPQGTTTDIEVVDADPRGYFETSAKAAVKRYKYRPKYENGNAVERKGVEVVLSFQLEK